MDVGITTVSTSRAHREASRIKEREELPIRKKKKSIVQKKISHQPRSNCYKWRTFKYILGKFYFALQSYEARRMCKKII